MAVFVVVVAAQKIVEVVADIWLDWWPEPYFVVVTMMAQ